MNGIALVAYILNYTFVAYLSLPCQVHKLDEPTWSTVEVVPIDIANKEEVAPGVSYTT